MVYLKTWLLFFRVLFVYFFSSNKTSPYYLAGKHLLSLSFRYPEKDKKSFIAFIKAFVKSLLLGKMSMDKAVSVYSPSHIFFYEMFKNDPLNNESMRLAQIKYFTNKAMNGSIWKEGLLGYQTLSDKLLQLIFEPILFVGLFPIALFKKIRGPVGLIFSEYIELVNLLKLLKKYQVKELYFSSIYEKDSNIASIAIKRLGINIIKIASLTPLKFWNSIIVATDTLALSDINQLEEVKQFSDTIQAQKVELWGPEDIAEVAQHYEDVKDSVKSTNVIGLYSTAGYIRTLEGNLEQNIDGYAKKINEYLVEYMTNHKGLKLIIFLHPIEKNPKYKQIVKDYYASFFEGLNYTIWESKLNSSHCFEVADLGVAFHSSVMYERLYFGFKCLWMSFGKDGIEMPESIQSICAIDKADFFAKMDRFLNMSWEEYFNSTGVKKSPFLLKREAAKS